MTVNQSSVSEDFETLTPGRTLVVNHTPPVLRSVSDEQAGFKRPCESALATAPKYTATVVDAPHANDRGFKHICAVFIVPQGLELDWLVSTPEGQAHVVAGADAARLFLVTLNRGHTFESAEEVQRELSPWIRSLVPTSSLPPVLQPGSIPYTTTPQGIGHRTVRLKTVSQINGPIVVEDVRLLEPGKAQPTTFRRMVFLDSPCLIQSEAVLIHPGNDSEVWESKAAVNVESSKQEQETGNENGEESDAGSDAPGRARASDASSALKAPGVEHDRKRETIEDLERAHRKAKRRKASCEAEREVQGLDTEAALSDGADPDFQENAKSPCDASPVIDSQVAAKLDSESFPQPTKPQVESTSERTDTDVSNGAIPTANKRGQSDRHTSGRDEVSRRGLGVLTEVDFSYLASEYLQAMVAGLSYLAADLDDRTASERLLDVLVVGLGGGGMPMFLRRHLACRLEVIEIDPTVVHVATTHFGVFFDPGFQVHVADAIPWIIAAAKDTKQASASNGGSGSFDAILIDVESSGGQCPPPAFLDPTFLSATRCLLRPGGLVAMNVVTDDESREAVYEAFHKVFGSRLNEWCVPQNSNRVLFACRTSEPVICAQPQPVRNVSPDPLGTHKGSALLTCAKDDDVSDEDETDLVYWASRLVEKGVQSRPWGRGPDLPDLASDIRPLRRQQPSTKTVT